MADSDSKLDLEDESVQNTLTIVAGQLLIGAAMSETPDADMGHILAMVTDTTGGDAETLILAAIRALQSLITSASLDIVDVGTVGGALIDSTNESESDGQ